MILFALTIQDQLPNIKWNLTPKSVGRVVDENLVGLHDAINAEGKRPECLRFIFSRRLQFRQNYAFLQFALRWAELNAFVVGLRASLKPNALYLPPLFLLQGF